MRPPCTPRSTRPGRRRKPACATCSPSSTSGRWFSRSSGDATVGGITMVVRPLMASYSVLRFVATAIRWLSVVAVVFVLAGLLGALTDEVRNSSKVSATRITQVQGGAPQTAVVDITQPDTPADDEVLRVKLHTAGREVIVVGYDGLRCVFS